MRWLVLFVVPVLVAGSVASQEKPAPIDISKLPILKVGETLEGEINDDDPIVLTEILKTSYSQAPTRGTPTGFRSRRAAPIKSI